MSSSSRASCADRVGGHLSADSGDGVAGVADAVPPGSFEWRNANIKPRRGGR